jgi:hypothetical protein
VEKMWNYTRTEWRRYKTTLEMSGDFKRVDLYFSKVLEIAGNKTTRGESAYYF